MSRVRSGSNDAKKLSTKQYVLALYKVAHTTFRAAPFAVVTQAIGAVVSSVLPIVTTYFAAITTTLLADAYAGKADAGNQAITYVAVTALLGVCMTAWRSFEGYISQLMRYKVEASMTDRMYEHFLSLEFWRYDDKETADLYDKARKFAQFFPHIFSRLSSVVTAIVGAASGIIALLIVSWWLSLFTLIAIIPGIVIQFRLSRVQAQHWNKNLVPRRTVSWIEWGLMQPEKIAELRLYGLVRKLLDLRYQMRDLDEKTRIEFERGYIGKRFGADMLEALIEVCALVWTVLQIIAHRQPIGQFIYVQQVVGRAIGGASSLVNAVSSMDEDIANLYDYQAFMDLPVVTGRTTAVEGVPTRIEVDHVTFRYPTSVRDVLSDVSLQIDRGQHIAIVGENGAGKSTLVKVITGLYEPMRGSVTIDGQLLSNLDPASWHAQLGVLSQEFVKYDFANARDNILYGDVSQPVSKRRLDEAIMGAEAEFLRKLPQGLDTYVDQWMEDDEGRKGQELSGGQWQRLALARNFYRDAPVIILDEPTSAIDALAEARIFDRLFATKEKTIIAISHRLSTVKKADVIYVMSEGRIVEQGRYDELIASRGVFYEMFAAQL